MGPEDLPSPLRPTHFPPINMPKFRTELTPARRPCRSCKELKDSATDFYPPSGVTPYRDCKLCANAIRYSNRQAAMATEEGRERRRAQWRHDKQREAARKRMDPKALAAMDAAAKKAKEDAKSRREAFARFRLADALREERMKIAQGSAYVPRGMRAPWAANSKRRRALGKSLEELKAEKILRKDEVQPAEVWNPRDFSDIQTVRNRHGKEASAVDLSLQAHTRPNS